MQLAQWLRLAALWAPDSAIFSAHVTDWSRNGTLCRMYLCISLGLLEPAFLLSALLLCSAALRYAACCSAHGACCTFDEAQHDQLRHKEMEGCSRHDFV